MYYYSLLLSILVNHINYFFFFQKIPKSKISKIFKFPTFSIINFFTLFQHFSHIFPSVIFRPRVHDSRQDTLLSAVTHLWCVCVCARALGVSLLFHFLNTSRSVTCFYPHVYDSRHQFFGLFGKSARLFLKGFLSKSVLRFFHYLGLSSHSFDRMFTFVPFPPHTIHD